MISSSTNRSFGNLIQRKSPPPGKQRNNGVNAIPADYALEKEQLNCVDTQYVTNDTISDSSLKHRSRYAQFGISDMGIPALSPGGLSSSPDLLPISDCSPCEDSPSQNRTEQYYHADRSVSLNRQRAEENSAFDSSRALHRRSKSPAAVGGGLISERFGHVLDYYRELDKRERYAQQQLPFDGRLLSRDDQTRYHLPPHHLACRSSSADNLLSDDIASLRIVGGGTSYTRSSADNLLDSQQRMAHLVKDSRSSQTNGHLAASESGSRSTHDHALRHVNSNAVGGSDMHHMLRCDEDVDYSHHDFRESFNAIEQAARHGAIKVRKEGDTTIVTEHRDPYSFYWQLDQIRRQQEDPPRRRFVQEENIIEETQENAAQVQSPDSHDSGIQVEYIRPSKPVKKLAHQFEERAVLRDASPTRKLPHGWERHEDPRGFSYYWHVDSGTITREPPRDERPPLRMQTPPMERPEEKASYLPRAATISPAQSPAVRDLETPVERIVEKPIFVERQLQPHQPVIVERAFKQTTTKRRVENDSSDSRDAASDNKPIRFAVRSLGCTEISEDDLTPERSSRAVNKAIVDLSTGRNDLIDNVAKWGDGKELIMELDDRDLRLTDPDSGNLLHVQPIHQIRVWGVGRDNGRDFAYVARDRSTRRFMCHVFRCDTPARTIANTLRDICKRLMLERRPYSLPAATTALSYSESSPSFPTPMDEPKKVIRCHFLGVTQVPRATGIEVLNEAVDRLVSQVKQERWILVDVGIAPSTITITEVGGNLITECRVRYLSFLGIGRDIKHCAFIMHTSTDSFMCYVFHVEPSAGAMAKTIEAACKLRYQKAIDSHGERRNGSAGKVLNHWG